MDFASVLEKIDLMRSLARMSPDVLKKTPFKLPDVPVGDLSIYREAAVTVPLIKDPITGQARLLMIQRKIWDGDPHSGQIAFPGGGREPDDADLYATAVRETNEEIGLPLGLFSPILDFPAVPVYLSRYMVTPFLVSIEAPVVFNPDPTEIARVLTFPLEYILDDNRRLVLTRSSPSGSPVKVDGFDFGFEPVWGATGVIVSYLQILLSKALNDNTY